MAGKTVQPVRVRLKAPLSASDSGTKAFLGLCDDGEAYWIKAPDNPQGPQALIPERVVAGIAGLIDAPAPQSAIVEIPAGISWSIAPGWPLKAGLAHGSRNMERVGVSSDGTAFLAHDENRARHARFAALWDLCLGGDAQWLHRLDGDHEHFTFDHNFWLASEADWSLDAIERVGLRPWRYEVELGVLSQRGLRAVAERLGALQHADFLAVTETVPVEWETSTREMERLAAYLFCRVEGVVERLEEAAQHAKHP